MKFTILTAICATLLTAVNCAPVDAAAQEQQTQAANKTWLEGFSKIDFKGFQKRYEVDFHVCTDIRADFPPWTEGGLSAVRAEWPGVECTLFANAECIIRPEYDSDWGDRLGVWQSHYDLEDPEIGWGKKAHAFLCFPLERGCGCGGTIKNATETLSKKA